MQTEREKTAFQLDNMWGMPRTKNAKETDVEVRKYETLDEKPKTFFVKTVKSTKGSSIQWTDDSLWKSGKDVLLII